MTTTAMGETAPASPVFERTYVQYTRSPGGIGRLTLDRPPLNVLHIGMLEELEAVLGEIEHDASVKVLVISGAGPAFCAGADVRDHLPERAACMLERFRAVVRRLLSMECPTLAAVHGAALGGGCELMLACDLVIAAENAQIGQPEVRLGVLPPIAAALLPRMVGRQRALDLVLTGRTLSATEALALGLVTRVVPTPLLNEAVEGELARLCASSGPVLRLAKRAVLEAGALPPLSGMLRAEEIYLDELMRLQDPLEGLDAFLAKRPPVWKEA
jgi:cyclohexa-1,5-dienecarbonyl-CoA hydratase